MNLRLGIVVAGFLLTAGPVLAQRPEPGAGSGGDRASAGTSGGGGAAVSSGGGGGGNIASGGGGGSTSSSSSGGFSPSASSVSSPSISLGDRSVRMSAPEHRMSYSDSNGPRSHTATSGSGQSDKATPRTSTGGSSARGSSASGSSGSSSNSGARSGAASGSPRSGANSEARANGPASERAANREARSPRDSASPNAGASRRADDGTASNNVSGASEVPSWSRPRGDRPVTDTAVDRVGPPPDRDHNHGGYGGYADPYYYGGFGYSFGLGFYDRNYYGYPFYSPIGFGYGIPSGYFDPFYSDPYDYGAGYGAYSSSVYGGHDSGSLKLKVKPHNAKVYVDGYYAGTVDQFDGAFQKLALNGGRHKVELQAEGYETTEFDVLISPQQTVTFAGNMKKNQ